jgi:hypothetical protein
MLARVTSPNLKRLGANVHDVWRHVIGDLRFAARYVDGDVLPLVVANAPDVSWSAWFQKRRYGSMK